MRTFVIVFTITSLVGCASVAKTCPPVGAQCPGRAECVCQQGPF